MVALSTQLRLVLIFGWTSLLMVGMVAGFCPYGCGCDETNSRVTCIRSDLEVRPPKIYSFTSYRQRWARKYFFLVHSIPQILGLIPL
jgi:hypothetical protein